MEGALAGFNAGSVIKLPHHCLERGVSASLSDTLVRSKDKLMRAVKC